MDVSEETLREFMRKYYPKYADNLALARVLYAKHAGKISRGIIDVNTSKIELFLGMKVRITGIVESIRRNRYQACLVCGRAKCEHDGAPRGERFAVDIMLADNYGDARCVGWFDPGENPLSEPEMDEDEAIGMEIEVTGIVSRDDEGIYVKMIDVRQVTTCHQNAEEAGAGERKEKIEEIVKLVEDVGGVSQEILNKILARYGVEMRELEGMIFLDNGKWRAKKP